MKIVKDIFDYLNLLAPVGLKMSFDNVGITPDYTVDITAQQAENIKFADAESDPQLQKALEAVAAK